MRKNIFCSYVLLLTLAVVIFSCSNEHGVVEKKVVQAPVPASAKATVLALSTTVVNGGTTANLLVSGNGCAEYQDFDGTEYITNSYNVLSDGVVNVKLEKDTIEVEQFGVDLVSNPQDITATDSVNAEKVGQFTTMSAWSFSDGQTANGFLLWLYDKAANYNEVKLPHAVVENLRFNRVTIEPLSERFALVTLSFLADVKGVNSPSTTGEGEKEIRLTYIQALPEKEPEVVTPDEPKSPSYELSFSIKNDLLKASLTITTADGQPSTQTWTAFKCGLYNGLSKLLVASTSVSERDQNVYDYPKENKDNSFEKDGLTWTTQKICKQITLNRQWNSTGGGLIGTQENVFAYSTSMVVLLPTGEKLEVRLQQETVFCGDTFSAVSALNGDVQTLPNESTEYMYNTSCTYSSKHYVTCTVVDFNGVEHNRLIECLPSDGLFLHNTGTVNLYTVK